MSPKNPPPSVFYPRRTLVAAVAAASAVWLALLVFSLGWMSAGQREEMRALRAQIARLREETAGIRTEKNRLEAKTAGLRARLRALARRPPSPAAPPPALAFGERFLPLGKAAEVVAGRLFVTPVAIEGRRLRLRVARLAPRGETNRTRALAPGESWRFAFGKNRYVLLLHAVSADPPGARISIRRFPDETPPDKGEEKP